MKNIFDVIFSTKSFSLSVAKDLCWFKPYKITLNKQEIKYVRKLIIDQHNILAEEFRADAN